MYSDINHELIKEAYVQLLKYFESTQGVEILAYSISKDNSLKNYLIVDVLTPEKFSYTSISYFYLLIQRDEEWYLRDISEKEKDIWVGYGDLLSFANDIEMTVINETTCHLWEKSNSLVHVGTKGLYTFNSFMNTNLLKTVNLWLSNYLNPIRELRFIACARNLYTGFTEFLVVDPITFDDLSFYLVAKRADDWKIESFTYDSSVMMWIVNNQEKLFYLSEWYDYLTEDLDYTEWGEFKFKIEIPSKD